MAKAPTASASKAALEFMGVACVGQALWAGAARSALRPINRGILSTIYTTLIKDMTLAQ